MKNLKKKIMVMLLIIAQYSLTQTIQPKVIIWDLGGVLLESSKWPYVNEIGITNILSYMLSDWRFPNLKPQLFDILRNLETIEEKKLPRAPLNDGTSMPLLLSKWQSGSLLSNNAIEKALTHIDELYNKKEIKSFRQKILLEQIIRAMFNAQILSASIYPIIEGVKLFQECAQLKNSTGDCVYTMVILSNWDKESFPSVYIRFPEIFSHLHSQFIFISGEIGFHKPQEESFRKVLKNLKVHPQECLFIDDQIVNIEAAEKLGIKALHLENRNYKKLRADLIREGVLKN